MGKDMVILAYDRMVKWKSVHLLAKELGGIPVLNCQLPTLFSMKPGVIIRWGCAHHSELDEDCIVINKAEMIKKIYERYPYGDITTFYCEIIRYYFFRGRVVGAYKADMSKKFISLKDFNKLDMPDLFNEGYTGAEYRYVIDSKLLDMSDFIAVDVGQCYKNNEDSVHKVVRVTYVPSLLVGNIAKVLANCIKKVVE